MSLQYAEGPTTAGMSPSKCWLLAERLFATLCTSAFLSRRHETHERMEIVLGEKALGGFGDLWFAHSHACRATEYLCPAVAMVSMNWEPLVDPTGS
jgi:hypothetical protein